jgi:ArsR family transcriptional regulator
MVRFAQWFYILSDVTRLHIIELLTQRERCVSELQQVMEVVQSTISFHLKVLKDAGLARVRRDPPWTYYALEPGIAERLTAFMEFIKPGSHTGTCPLSCCQSPLRGGWQL